MNIKHMKAHARSAFTTLRYHFADGIGLADTTGTDQKGMAVNQEFRVHPDRRADPFFEVKEILAEIDLHVRSCLYCQAVYRHADYSCVAALIHKESFVILTELFCAE